MVDVRKLYKELMDEFREKENNLLTMDILYLIGILLYKIKLNKNENTLKELLKGNFSDQEIDELSFLKKYNIKVFFEIIKQNKFKDLLRKEYDLTGITYRTLDSKELGIVLTPKKTTELMCEVIDVKKGDTILDPTSGSGSFLISSINRGVKIENIHAIEMNQQLFLLLKLNLLSLGVPKDNIRYSDMFDITQDELRNQGINKVLINPPYSQPIKEINFIRHALGFINKGGKMAAIVPQSTMVGKSGKDKEKKRDILKNHTLELVITLNTDTFYGVGTNPCIAVFTAFEPHPEKKLVKFINFQDDGFVVRKHIGLVGDGTEKDKRDYLLDVIRGYQKAPSSFMVESTVTWEDEWLHSFYYFNDTPPTVDDFKKTMADYLTFEFDMKAHGRGYLFDKPEEEKEDAEDVEEPKDE